MLRGLLRLLVRLFFFGLIVGAVGFVVTRLMGGEDEDFEDFDDLESSFEFNETPVEIEVSASTDAPGSVAPTGSEAPGADADVADVVTETENSYPLMSGSGDSDDTDSSTDDASDTTENYATLSDAAEDASTESASGANADESSDDITESSSTETRSAALNTTVFTDLPETEGPRLIDIKGIGPSYESRLHSIGIQTMQDLINADANHIAEELDVIGGPSQVEEWVKQAHAMLEEHQG